MVRLKDVIGQPKTGSLLFQFHYGTIKSVVEYYDFFFVPLFQFHYGTIKSRNNTTLQAFQKLFQFHYGTIKSTRVSTAPLRICISIPLWYD